MKIYVVTYHYPGQSGDAEDLVFIGAYSNRNDAIEATKVRASETGQKVSVYYNDDDDACCVSSYNFLYQISPVDLT